MDRHNIAILNHSPASLSGTWRGWKCDTDHTVQQLGEMHNIAISGET